MSEKKKPSKTEKLNQLYAQASKLNDDFPAQLIKKMEIYGDILELIGRLWAEAQNDWRHAEAMRRETIATVYSLDPEGTVKDKEMKAEMAAAEWRKKEAQYEAEALRWRNAYNSVQEQIQIMKKKYEHMVNVAKGGI
ncbi:hypothetical protein P9726_00630 [Geobacillus stearothermophilus]|uniref:hypothetical protein n=1 Tax=Geobacillus stearothermophilus TaxID=1422 RepID=UPI002E21CA72|nr:hypothetical protein [Geobacillus stearothermophilus]